MYNILIICNYNEGRTGSLQKCLASLQKNKIQNTIIGIIDNGSKDNSYEIIHKYQINKVIDYAIFNTKNVGKAKALNTLLKYIYTICTNIDLHDALIYSIDSDIELLQDNFIFKMNELFNTNTNITLVGLNVFTNGISGHLCVTENNDIINLNGLNYYNVSNTSINSGFRGLGGQLLVLPISKFAGVNFYNETLGPNGSSAIYGGDDALLLLNLYNKYKNTLLLCTKDLFGNHPETKNKQYLKWKEEQNLNMANNGFSNNTLAISGFYD